MPVQTLQTLNAKRSPAKLWRMLCLTPLLLPLLPAHADTGQIPAPTTAAQVPGPVAGAPLSAAYVQAIGRMAYLWGWPLVNMHNRQATFAKVPYPGLLGGMLPVVPANQLAMLSDYVSPDQRFVTCPNQDVVYGAGFMDLAKEPAVIQVPDFGERFWVYQVVDQRTDSFARFGKQYQTQPGLYLLAGPDWEGEVPEGITAVYRSSTNINAIFPRVFMDDSAEDRAAVQPLVDQVMMYPLSQYTGKPQTTDWSAAITIPEPQKKGDAETAWVVPEKFFEQLPTVMDEVPPLPGEEALYAWIRQILAAAKDNPELQQALMETAVATEQEILAPMFQFRGNGVAAGNGWRTQKNAARFGSGYFQRTATAKGNMFSNMPEETMYFGADFDSNGERINGNKAYSVTFAKGQLPPVNGFWSLTLYNEQHFFNPNPLNRFSLGTKNNNLKYNADGSLTLYTQPTSPGADKESNWLPAPADADYSLYIRAYWPRETIVKGQWVPPTIQPLP
jgi:hypothetical protein